MAGKKTPKKQATEKEFTFDLSHIDELKEPVTIPVCKVCGTKLENTRGRRKLKKTREISRQYKCTNPKCPGTISLKNTIIWDPDTIIIPDYGNAITKTLECVEEKFKDLYQAEYDKGQLVWDYQIATFQLFNSPNANVDTPLTTDPNGIKLSEILNKAFKVITKKEIEVLLRVLFYAAIGQKDKNIWNRLKKYGDQAGKKDKALNSNGDIVILVHEGRETKESSS